MKKHLFYVLVIVVIFSSCKQKTEKGEMNTKEENKTLIIGAMSSMDFVPVAVAKKMNFFSEYGIDVTIEKFYSANDRDAAFQAGRVDGTVIDYTGAILQKAGGIELKLTSACNAPFAIVSTPGKDINTIEKLKGQKIALSRNTVIDFCIDMALQSVNLPESAVEKIEINKIPLRFEMLMKGEVQATALPDPFLTIAKSKNCPVITTMDSLGYAVTGIMFSQKSIDGKSNEIQAFYKAYNKAVDYISEHSVQDIKDILVTDIGFPEELIPTVKLPAYTHARIPSEKDIQATINWLTKRKLIVENFDKPGIIDSRFVQ